MKSRKYFFLMQKIYTYIFTLMCDHRKIQTCQLKCQCYVGYIEENNEGIFMDHDHFSMDMP